jgi:hypothetical protein
VSEIVPVLVVTILLSRLRRVSLLSVVAFSLTRLAALALLSDFIWRWILPGLPKYSAITDVVRADLPFTVAATVLSVALLAMVDPTLRHSLMGAIPGINRHVVRLAPMTALLALTVWSGHYLVTGAPGRPFGYRIIVMTITSGSDEVKLAQPCPLGPSTRSLRLAGGSVSDSRSASRQRTAAG